MLQSSIRMFNRSLPIRQGPPVKEGVVRGWCGRRRSKHCFISFSLTARGVDQTLVGRPPQSEVFIEASLDLIKDYLGLGLPRPPLRRQARARATALTG